MNKALSIVGSSRANGEREKDDFYPTPRYAVEELLKRETYNGSVWECACVEGDISEVFIKKGYDVRSSDLIDRGYGIKENFFMSKYKSDNIVTNPPYKYALEFVIEAKRKSRRKIAMFLKTVFLESDKRKMMFQDTNYPLKKIYQFSKRVSLYKNGEKMKNS